MKKKILIVDKSFAVGGIQTALINMVKELKNVYDITVLMFYNDGILKNRFPDDVKIIEPCYLMKLHGMSISDAKKKNIATYILKSVTGAWDRLFTNAFSIWFALMFQKKLTGYDVAIAFHHEDSPKASISGFYRFVSSKTDAPIKLGWIHYDPRFVSYDDKKNRRYMKKMTKLVCVSKGTADNFINCHPMFRGNVEYCYNFQDIERILELSSKDAKTTPGEGDFMCFSACRLTSQKAIPRAIRAFAPVLHRHKDVKWYIAGDGNERTECEQLIKQENLINQIILLGAIDNPYPYMKRCDLYIQPSIYEAAPMVYGEALICQCPIFTTENISASEMIDRKYGFICENSEAGLRTGLRNLLANRELIAEMHRNLEAYQYTNDVCNEQIKKLTSG